jgi:phosphoserine phosphatase RsbX
MTHAGVETAVYLRPCAGEIVSGDAALTVTQETGLFLAIVDALGHGRQAHAVAEEMAGYLRAQAGTDLLSLARRLHQESKGTLGAAVGLTYLETATGRLRYVGIGNTRLRRFGATETRLVSRDGTVGRQVRTPREECLQLEAGDLILLTTDGVREHFGLEDYPGLLGDSPAVVARSVVERFGREHDDATCIALRYRP